MAFDLSGRRVLVLGLGATGMSMTRWLSRHGALVSVADTRAEPPGAAELEREFPQIALERGEIHERSARGADLIAISPGIDRRTPAVAAAIGRGTPVAGDVEIFAQGLASLIPPTSSLVPPRVVAITGTNGKSTVACMARDICVAAGLDTIVAGNIGVPVLDALAEIENGRPMPGAFVLELSSFQLESTASLKADAAAMLNLSDDHLDRYDGFADYAAAKARVFNGSGAQVLNRDDPASMSMALPGRVVLRFGLGAPHGEREWGIASRAGNAWLVRDDAALMPVAELAVAGMHNAGNALAAGALCHAIGAPDASITSALRNFKGLRHRLERVAEIEGIVFYDDSKGTNVGSTVAALNGSAQPVVLIAGGDGKGQDFSPLRGPVIQRARSVILIGRDRERIAAALTDCGVPVVRAADMEQAVSEALAASRRGDAVLLSPACASFDMFKNYGHRGDVFAAAVKKLARETARRGGTAD